MWNHLQFLLLYSTCTFYNLMVFSHYLCFIAMFCYYVWLLCLVAPKRTLVSLCLSLFMPFDPICSFHEKLYGNAGGIELTPLRQSSIWTPERRQRPDLTCAQMSLGQGLPSHLLSWFSWLWSLEPWEADGTRSSPALIHWPRCTQPAMSRPVSLCEKSYWHVCITWQCMNLGVKVSTCTNFITWKQVLTLISLLDSACTFCSYDTGNAIRRGNTYFV
jgi:hypothetical protein